MTNVRPLSKKKSFQIKTVDGRVVEVWRLVRRRVVHDIYGKHYFLRWNKNAELTTPGQRRKKIWTINDIRYVEFPHGLIDVERGVHQAMADGLKDIPRLKDLQAFVEKIKGKILLLEKIDEPMEEAMRKKVVQLLAKISPRSAQPMRESKAQAIYCLTFKDQSNRINLCVVACRLSAVDDRVRERLETVHAWTKKFAPDLVELGSIREQFYKFLKRLNRSLDRDLKILDPGLNDTAAETLRKNVLIYKDNLVPWLHIEPFAGWAFHTNDDFNAIKARLYLGRYDLIAKLYQDLKTSIRLMLIQEKIFDLISFLTKEARTVPVGENVCLTARSKNTIVNFWTEITAELAVIDDTSLRNRIASKALERLEAIPSEKDSSIFGQQPQGYPAKTLVNFKEKLKEVARLF